jgi:hypothetical protein
MVRLEAETREAADEDRVSKARRKTETNHLSLLRR